MLAALKLRIKIHNWGLNKRSNNQFTLVYSLLVSEVYLMEASPLTSQGVKVVTD